MSQDKAIFLMAYGTPETLDDVGPYFQHIRHGRMPSPEAVENLKARYTRVGGATPLRLITEAQRDGLQREIDALGMPHRVYVGMKHWHPYIAETMAQMKADGIKRFTGIVLAPHYSKMSIGQYRHAVDEAQAALGNPFEFTFVDSWYQEPRFVGMMVNLIQDAMRQFPEGERDNVTVVFTAHSLPVRIREWGDPYESQLLESSRAVASLGGIRSWRFAWQSAGGTGEPWIGPDILDFLDELHKEGVRNVLQVPIGFVCDHLEVLYDIDIEAKSKAAELGMTLHRTELPNAKPAFIKTLAAIAMQAEGAAAAV
ncbi:MAG TPA: ferrochelatase [Gemmatimonadaceae bacterium]|jgi:ferrochelatase|nr:ferrochelatase [Gemmatimonadaceae bacterium]